ncbi:DUF6233 domain-containing protein [Streptomyces sp. NPDC056601]|uniref:DUF6233 domain-containing protein n=1 Tax=Streptomyces sp. NPDC056601 TaxID=3345875 RepID=UPI0036875579
MALGSRDPVYAHTGDCHMANKRSRGVDRDQALRAIAEGVQACTHCRPDTELGLLDSQRLPLGTTSPTAPTRDQSASRERGA